MATSPRHLNPSAQVIRSLLHHKYDLSVYSKYAPYALPAEVAELNMETGFLALTMDYGGSDIEHYVRDDRLNLDIEAQIAVEPGEREVYSLSRLPTKALKIDSATYRLECQLPKSVFVQEKRGTIRIPFVLGMRTRVNIEVYPHELSLSGHLQNLSSGGCMVELALADSIAISMGQRVPGITLEFPSGRSFFAEGRIHHLRPFGNHGYAAAGIEFINMTTTQAEALFQYVSEAEREASYRTGANSKVASPSPLFIPGAKERKIRRHEEQERKKRARQSSIQRDVLRLAHQLQIGLMYIKTRDFFPEDTLYDCADTLLRLAATDRKALLYAIAFLRDEPDWARHAIQTAAQLADMLLLRDPHSPRIREAVLGALMHTMGKPLLISEELPSLKVNMKPHQKEMLKEHVTKLRDRLEVLGWTPSPTCRDVLENANERLDGSGYPTGKRGDQLSELVRLVSVLKIINKLCHERNSAPPRATLDAYRWVNDAADAYDNAILVECIRQYGPYPIGSLVKFSFGFLAWVMDIDAKGTPTKVNVIKNLSFRDANMNTVLSKKDFSQIGSLIGVVNPAEYGVRVIKL